MKGIFAVFEGIDGSGKTTLLRNTAALLSNPVLLKEPSELPSGLLIRKKLAAKEQLKSSEWLTLFLEDRYANLRENILPALRSGKTVLQDRYYYSTAAYQGEIRPDPYNKDQLTAEQIISIHQERGFPEPDLLFYIDLDTDTALGRILSTRSGTESFETKEHLNRILRNYRTILPSNVIRLDGKKNPQELAAEAAALIRKAAQK